MKKQQVKFESLNSSKFEAFKGSELQNTMQVVGGTAVETSSANWEYDSIDSGTRNSMECGVYDFCTWGRYTAPVKKN